MFRILALGILALALFFSNQLWAQAPTREMFAKFNFSTDEFKSLQRAIVKREKWSPGNGLSSSFAPSIRRLLGAQKEISDIGLSVLFAKLKFQRNQADSAKTVNEFEFSHKITDALEIREELLNWTTLQSYSSPPIVAFNHSQPGTTMPVGGYVSDPRNKAQLRLLLNSAEDTQLVVFLPVQADPFQTGFMVCPRELSKIGNSSVGRHLTASKFSLAKLGLDATADVLAKVLEGYGAGVSYSSIRVESFPASVEADFFIEDLNAGYFPESVVVLPENQQNPEMPFIPNQLNELGLRIDITLKDSGDNQWLVSFKRSFGVLPTQLETSEPMTAGAARLSVQPGQCYLVIQRTWYDSKKIAGNKEIELPQ
jgi:hypothetical protein